MGMRFSADDGKLYDVVAVNISNSTVRVIERGKTLPNAEAVVAMAVMRRGVDKEFFAEVPSGSHRDGDQFKRA